MTTLEDIFATTRILAFERYNFIGRKQKKMESLEQFHSDLVELAHRADCGDREDEWVRDMFTAHMNNAYKYAIRREKGIEHGRTMKINPFGGQTTTTKLEPAHYLQPELAIIVTQKIRTHKEVGVVSADDLIHMNHKTQ